jgi:hypothetical protein
MRKRTQLHTHAHTHTRTPLEEGLVKQFLLWLMHSLTHTHIHTHTSMGRRLAKDLQMVVLVMEWEVRINALAAIVSCPIMDNAVRVGMCPSSLMAMMRT